MVRSVDVWSVWLATDGCGAGMYFATDGYISLKVAGAILTTGTVVVGAEILDIRDLMGV